MIQRIKTSSIYLVLILFSTINLIKAQSTLFGLTPSGGANANGQLFSVTTGTYSYTSNFDFPSLGPGQNPYYTSFIETGDGKLYGLTANGGANNKGLIFEYDPETAAYIKKFDFSVAANGTNPYGSLIQASNGNLYGMTSTGGTSNMGVIFEYDLTTSTYTKKFEFTGTASGSTPYGSLMQGNNGKLYGMTNTGGTNNLGVVFEYDLTTSVFTKLVDLSTANGSNPYGSLIQASNGKLYGMTSLGGTSSLGAMFQYDITTATYTKLFDFNGAAAGSSPFGSLLQASNGHLYGLTRTGGASSRGVLFEYNLGTSTYTKKTDLTTTTGGTPYASLIQATDGKLYGMTSANSTNSVGSLFEYDLTTSTFTRKVNMITATGGTSNCSLLQTSTGKLYGLTRLGGTASKGAIFEYDILSATYTKKMDLDAPTNGKGAEGTLMQASNGKIYGVSRTGGANNLGVLFEYDATTFTYSKKIDFNGAALGSSPNGPLTEGPNGKLYGLTKDGGANNIGVLYEFDIYTSTFTKLVDLVSATKGASPYGSPIYASNGKLYGIITGGGTSALGVLFEYDIATATYTKKLDFTGAANGGTPNGSLIQATNGKLYGLTRVGGSSGMGLLFEYDYTTSTYTKKLDLTGVATGSYPDGSVMQAANGKLYGMPRNGGTSDMGVLFEYDITSSTFTKKFDFTGAATGSYPNSTVLQTTDGKLYGMTPQGGTSSSGVIFEYDLSTSVFSKKQDFSSAIGTAPYGHLIEMNFSIGLPIELLYFEVACDHSTINLNWATATETNNKAFFIEGSEDGIRFNSVTELAGQGNSANQTQYNYSLSKNHNTYYRLKQVDHDGSFTYSKIISIEKDLCEEKNRLLLYPNPVKDKLFFSKEITAIISIYNNLGEIIITEALDNAKSIDLSFLKEGIYFLELNEDHYKFIKKD